MKSKPFVVIVVALIVVLVIWSRSNAPGSSEDEVAAATTAAERDAGATRNSTTAATIGQGAPDTVVEGAPPPPEVAAEAAADAQAAAAEDAASVPEVDAAIDTPEAANETASRLAPATAQRFSFIHGRSITSFEGLRKASEDALKKSPLAKNGAHHFVTAPFTLRGRRVRFGFAVDVTNGIYANRVCAADESNGTSPESFGYTGVPHHFGLVDDKVRVWLPQTNDAKAPAVRFQRWVLEFPVRDVARGRTGRARIHVFRRQADGSETREWQPSRSVRFWALNDEENRLSEAYYCNWDLLYPLN